MLAPIVARADGSRATACPVCIAPVPVPPDGGWVPVRCSACGTEFVATDGRSPPPPLPPPPPPAKPSPLAPPLGDWEPIPDAPRGFTSDVRFDGDGRRIVTCPRCRGADAVVPREATVAVVLRCSACHGPFLVNLRPASVVLPPVAGLLLPRPAAPPEPVFDPDGRFWSRCPNCGRAALTPERLGEAFVLTCTVCGQQVVVGEGPRPPRHHPLPAPPSLWARVRGWFRRR